jgi:hypothetical protein
MDNAIDGMVDRATRICEKSALVQNRREAAWECDAGIKGGKSLNFMSTTMLAME